MPLQLIETEIGEYPLRVGEARSASISTSPEDFATNIVVSDDMELTSNPTGDLEVSGDGGSLGLELTAASPGQGSVRVEGPGFDNSIVADVFNVSAIGFAPDPATIGGSVQVTWNYIDGGTGLSVSFRLRNIDDNSTIDIVGSSPATVSLIGATAGTYRLEAVFTGFATDPYDYLFDDSSPHDDPSFEVTGAETAPIPGPELWEPAIIGPASFSPPDQIIGL